MAQELSFVGVDTRAILTNNDTTAVVVGSVVCTEGCIFDVFAFINQTQKQQTNVTGNGAVSGLGCTGSLESFAVPVSISPPPVNPPGATFKKGPASANVNVTVLCPAGTDSDVVNFKIHLSE